MRRSLIAPLVLIACTEEPVGEPLVTAHGEALDPDAAPIAAIDRFAQARGDDPSVPSPNEAVDFDADFFRIGLGPDGREVAYYDFGMATGFTMPAYRLVDEDGAAIEGQLLILPMLPGSTSYSDFWQIVEVEVPPGYVPNSITSAAELAGTDYPEQLTVEALNRPVVAQGSVARLGTEGGRLFRAWVDDEIALAFDFAEAEPSVRGDLVDYAPIYVCLTEQGGFCVDATGRTHNVVEAVPPSPAYSPLWKPAVFPEAAFDDVSDLDSALATDPQELPLLVNCPLVEW